MWASFLSCQRCLLAKQVLLKEHKKVEGELRFVERGMGDGAKDKGNPPSLQASLRSWLAGSRMCHSLCRNKPRQIFMQTQSFYIWQLRCTSAVVLLAFLMHCTVKKIYKNGKTKAGAEPLHDAVKFYALSFYCGIFCMTGQYKELSTKTVVKRVKCLLRSTAYSSP